MWLDDDQDKVAAYLHLRRELCPQCGTAEADWFDPVARRPLDDPKWEATTMRCHGCAELEAVSEDIPREEKGVRVVLLPAKGDD